jgi:hypothetical protein
MARAQYENDGYIFRSYRTRKQNRQPNDLEEKKNVYEENNFCADAGEVFHEEMNKYLNQCIAYHQKLLK